MSLKPKAVILLSGGLDSATCLAIAIDKGFNPYCLTFDYGQQHHHEIDAAKEIARQTGVHHRIQTVPLRELVVSSLTGRGKIPIDRPLNSLNEIPSTYVPARNIIFLSLALGYAESIHANDIFMGANSIDYSGYPDCRPEFFAAYRKMAQLGTKQGVAGNGWHIHTPLIHLSKSEIVRKARELGVNTALTRSCYNPSPQGQPCGRCDSCRLRQKGFADAGVEDILQPV